MVKTVPTDQSVEAYLDAIEDGRTVCDLRVSGAHRASEPNVHVVLDADREKFAGMLLEYLT